MNKPKCLILCGIPLSGKSTFASKFNRDEYITISKDKIREEYFGRNYKLNKRAEKFVESVYKNKLRDIYQLTSFNFIIDNTNCKAKYINEVYSIVYKTHDVEIIRFPILLWKAYYRNIKRWLFTGKFIPFRVIKRMKYNYDRL